MKIYMYVFFFGAIILAVWLCKSRQFNFLCVYTLGHYFGWVQYNAKIPTRSVQVVWPVRLWPYHFLISKGEIKRGRRLIGVAIFWNRRELAVQRTACSSVHVPDCRASYPHYPSETFYFLRWVFRESKVVWHSFRPTCCTWIFPCSTNNQATPD